MKQIFYTVITIVILFTSFSGCKEKSKDPSDGSFGKDPSYALGMNIGSSLKADGLYLDWDEFLKGIKDILYGNETRFDMDRASEIFYEAYSANYEKRDAANRQEQTKFLEENSKKPSVTTTESGLQYEVITPGFGPQPAAQDVVRVHYRGTLVNGTEFDSSYSRGQPVEFPLDGVIMGWTEGLQLMNTGSKYRLVIPSELGYGSQDMSPQIPPNSTLIFEVELLDIVKE